jgi:hypothetical protein
MSVPRAEDLSGLTSLARDPRLDLRNVLLRVQTDLFLATRTRTPATIEAFEALACGLLPIADETLAARLARKLAPCADTPDAVIAALADRGKEARHVVVASAARLPAGLYDAALAAGGDLAGALAQRPDLDGGTIARLVELGEDGIDFAIAMNRAVSLPSPVVDELLLRAKTRAALAHALLSRGDLSGPEEAALYDHADAGRRLQIRARLEPFAALQRGSRGAIPGEAVAELLEDARCSKDAFAARLAALLGLPTTPDWRFEHPARHDLLAIALAALGVPSEDAVRCFLTLDPAIAGSVTTVIHLAGLSRSVQPPLAATLLEAILGRPVARRRGGRHAPAMDPSGAVDRGSGAVRDRARLEDIVRLVG